jgi:uncharacterized protein (DUF1810 family)
MNEDKSLERFIEAQKTDYENALREVSAGKKRSHWIWYIFPQIQGLGFSETSRFYAIKDLNEANAFLRHPVLGSRLVAICEELLALDSNNANRIFGSPDDLKLKSCMTLFSSLDDTDPVFQKVLDKFFNGVKDSKTLSIIGKGDEQ